MVRESTRQLPRECPICDGEFSNVNSLKRHWRDFHPDYDHYKCLRCNIGFKRHDDARLHRKHICGADIEKLFL